MKNDQGLPRSEVNLVEVMTLENDPKNWNLVPDFIVMHENEFYSNSLDFCQGLPRSEVDLGEVKTSVENSYLDLGEVKTSTPAR